MLAMADFVKAAYCLHGKDDTAWDCADCGKYPGVEYTRFGNGSPITGSACYGIVAKDPRNKRIVMAFAGSSDIAQWIADVKVSLEQVQVTGQKKVTGSFHSGYYNAWKANRFEWLQVLRQYHSDHPDYEIVVTGHSLGGSLTFAASTDLASEGLAHKVYAFAPARVGNSVWARSYLQIQPAEHTFRITHFKDPVPHFPQIDMTGANMRHAGIEIHFDKEVSFNSPYHVCQGGVEEAADQCGANQYAISVLDLPLWPYHLCYPGQCGTGWVGRRGKPCMTGSCGTAMWNGEGLFRHICHSTDPERMENEVVQV